MALTGVCIEWIKDGKKEKLPDQLLQAITGAWTGEAADKKEDGSGIL